MKYQLGALALILLSACGPKIMTLSLDNNIATRAHLAYEPFAFIESDTIGISPKKHLGHIEIKDGGFTLDCDYETIKKLAKKEALKLGGNCLVITEHKKPNLWSTCHQIKADVFTIDNAQAFENEVIWHADRKLEIADFKGSIEQRPFTASTASSFRYRLASRGAFPDQYTLIVETYFDCHLSYFQPSQLDSFVLSHEQLHFDITELYARNFIERVGKELLKMKQFSEKEPQILQEVIRELQLMQDAYDTDVYADRTQQKKWNQLIAEELSKTEKFAKKKLVIEK
ncbi:MAG: hypothetical protein IPN29_07005 [Saprospiraceae bacterium]|nr:hypothetical protein [Saprospiraceae bacterium]